MFGNLVPGEFQKSKLQISCFNQLFKYLEQLPVTVLFFCQGFLSLIFLRLFHLFHL